MEEETRIKSGFSEWDAKVAISGGDSLAFEVCDIILRLTEATDSSLLGGLGTLLQIDRLHIYGSRLSMLWGGVCDRNLVKVLALLRAERSGLAEIDAEKISGAIDRGEKINWPSVLFSVKMKCPDFKCGEIIVE